VSAWTWVDTEPTADAEGRLVRVDDASIVLPVVVKRELYGSGLTAQVRGTRHDILLPHSGWRFQHNIVDHSGDQAPAADPALDALDELLDFFGYFAPGQPEIEKATATIREALADRITAAEALRAVRWTDRLTAKAAASLSPEDHALIARLGRIADRDEEAGR